MSQHSATFQMNRFTLSFQGEIEAEYQQDHFNRTIRQIRASLILGMLVYGVFGVLDAFLFPNNKYALWAIRFLIAIPYTALIYGLSFHRRFRKYLNPAIASSFLVSGLGIIGMIALLPAQEIGAYYVGLLLVFMFYYTVCHMSFIWASITGVLVVVGYEITALWLGDTPLLVLITNNFFFLGGNLIGMVACYSIEQISRRDFVKAHLLEIEKGNIDVLNRELEERVENRTRQLISTNQSLKQEITERIEAEEKYRTLFEKSKDAVFITNRQGRFIDLNEAGVQLFGYESLDEILKVDIVQDIYLHPEQRIEFERIISAQGHVKDFRITCRRKDGEEIVVLETATVVTDKSNNVIGYQGIIRDVTKQLELERQLIQSQKMESIGLLAGGIAHDLNNVLTPMTMAIHILKDNVTGDKLLELLNTLSQNATRAADIVKQILTFARRTDTDYAPLLPSEVIEEVANILRHTFPKDITINLKLPPKLDPIIGNATQVHQILLNLCVNARDAMQAGGELTIETEYVAVEKAKTRHLTDVKPGKFIVIKVRDTGVGIPAAIMDRILEPFFTTKQIGKGTGLGLSVIHSIIKAHGGFLEVESTENVGSLFSVFFPADLSDLKSNIKRQESARIRGNNELILVVDDEKSVRTLVKDVLEDNNYRVLLAENGLVAVEVFSKNKAEIDLVITDMIMPEMNGQAAIEEIRTLRKDIPVIVISGLIDDKMVVSSQLEARVQKILMKPFTAPELLKTVGTTLQGQTH